jgi:hypothetical protein
MEDILAATAARGRCYRLRMPSLEKTKTKQKGKGRFESPVETWVLARLVLQFLESYFRFKGVLLLS